MPRCWKSGLVFSDGRPPRNHPRTGAAQSIQLPSKGCDVGDQFRCFSVHGPDVAARATVMVNVAVAHGQQPGHITVARWALRDYCHGSDRRKSRTRCSERTLMRRFSMTKRNAHAAQRKYTKPLALANALAPAAWHFGQGVTGRPPWSLGLGILRTSDGRGWRTERASRTEIRKAGISLMRTFVNTEVFDSDPFSLLASARRRGPRSGRSTVPVLALVLPHPSGQG